MNPTKTLPITIRPFDRATDYPARVAVHNATYPDRPVTAEELKHWDAKDNPDPKYLNRYVVAEQAGQVVGTLWYGHWSGMYHPQKLYFDLAVHPEARNRGVGSALYTHMFEGIAPHDPLQITNVAYENQPVGLEFLRKRGFQERMRFWESHLDVAGFNPAPFEGVFDRVAAAGIEIRNELELRDDPDFQRKLYDLLVEVTRDVPTPDPITPEPFERFVETRKDDINRIPEAYFVAVDKSNGRYAGTSALWKANAAEYLKTGFTAVRQEYRHKGIAVALKLHAIDYAKRAGAPSIKTDNESNNRPMLNINEMLGFKRGTIEIDMCKKLKEEI